MRAKALSCSFSTFVAKGAAMFFCYCQRLSNNVKKMIVKSFLDTAVYLNLFENPNRIINDVDIYDRKKLLHGIKTKQKVTHRGIKSRLLGSQTYIDNHRNPRCLSSQLLRNSCSSRVHIHLHLNRMTRSKMLGPLISWFFRNSYGQVCLRKEVSNVKHLLKNAIH